MSSPAKSVAKVYSVLDDFYFWIETEDGRCRRPERQDIQSLSWDRSAKAFRELSKQVIANALPGDANRLLKFLQFRWYVGSDYYDVRDDTEIIRAFNNRLEQHSGLNEALARVIKTKMEVNKNQGLWSLMPDNA